MGNVLLLASMAFIAALTFCEASLGATRLDPILSPYPNCSSLSDESEANCVISECYSRQGHPERASTVAICKGALSHYYSVKRGRQAREEQQAERMRQKHAADELKAKKEEEQRRITEQHQAERQQQEKAEQEESRKRREAELAQIRAGTLKPKGCADVADVENGSMLTQVLIEPSKKYQYTLGQIERYASGVLLLRLPARRGQTSGPLFFKAITSPKTIWFDKDKLSIGQLVTITGRYVANEEVQLVSGASAPVAVFETTCVESTVRSMF